MVKKPDIIYVNFYTDGSAARKMAPVFSGNDTPHVTRRRPQKRKILYVDPVAILGLVVAVCMLVMMGVGLTQFQQARHRVEVMEAYVNELEDENALLQSQYDANVDLESVEKTALALGMVPVEQVQTTVISVSVPQIPEPTQTETPWQQFINFLSGLFA